MNYQTIELTAEQLDWEPNDTRFQESEEAMISYGNQLAVKDDNDNTLIISALTSLTIPYADITGYFNFGPSMVPKLKSPVILADGIVSEFNELIISVLSL